MHLVALIAGLICCLGVALDAFQTIILPRRPTGRLRITTLFFALTWGPWSILVPRIRNKKVREQAYSIYGPSSLLLLLGLWALLLVTGFAFFYFALGSPFQDAMQAKGSGLLGRFGTDLYVSGTTLFTLGLGDVVPRAVAARVLLISESGVGLGFVALVIGYVPVLYQAFSRREVSVALLDARAGSPPTATELLRRHGFEGGQEALSLLLAEWERWSAEILESHISYPILCYYRSQHDNQSWLSALVSILDTCALLISIMDGTPARQAQLTFAMARHALIDLGHVFHLEEKSKACLYEGTRLDRLPPKEFARVCDALGDISIRMCGDPASAQRLHTIRTLYEPHAIALSEYLRMPLPTWLPEKEAKDQWRTITRLRGEAEDVLGGAVHVSALAVSSDLEDEGH
ncbi:potassium channel family protein [Granulicella sp. dw_53]|uniref:potassium channel family protein n=1 Tax=Granulicella sp. dw_53 TaxID=2719792 RepID=UPI001BD3820F|nr:potassium channel family protein [Granulicella sp. dw_53]